MRWPGSALSVLLKCMIQPIPADCGQLVFVFMFGLADCRGAVMKHSAGLSFGSSAILYIFHYPGTSIGGSPRGKQDPYECTGIICWVYWCGEAVQLIWTARSPGDLPHGQNMPLAVRFSFKLAASMLILRESRHFNLKWCWWYLDRIPVFELKPWVLQISFWRRESSCLWFPGNVRVRQRTMTGYGNVTISGLMSAGVIY